ncbi:MAG TPA: RidA family protein [Candidatus Kapabacteria bacterium]|nr:RidA family protein [Candidatus Kapabacteria bacterium]
MNIVINPPSLVKPVGYAHAIKTAGGTTIYLAGQVSFDGEGNLINKGDIISQFRQAIRNLEIATHEAGAKMTDIVKMTIFTTSKELYKKNLREIGEVYREFFGKYFPVMTLVEVKSLFEDDALLEIEGIAVIP